MIMSLIPWWVWALCAVAALVAIILYAPWVVALWQRLPSSVRWALSLIGTLGLAFLAGRNRGAKDMRDQQARRDAQAVAKRKEIDDAVDNLGDADLDERYDRWVRKDK